MNRIRVAIVGLGKIARDQHLPSIATNETYELVGVASPNHRLPDVPSYPSLEALLQEQPQVQALALCTPPQVRYQAARYALERGRHVMLEKPPGATLSEVASLSALAERQGVTLFATWHSREAAGVEPARAWLAQRTIRSMVVNWKEDVRVWHPGQAWIWKAGGLGVFDPGINALSILTRILPEGVKLHAAELYFPANCETPIAARLDLVDAQDVPIRCEFDFRQTGPQSWDIDVETDQGRLRLSKGGALMSVEGAPALEAPNREYPRLYEHFAQLIRERRSDVDCAPLQIVADAFMCGRRIEVEPFHE